MNRSTQASPGCLSLFAAPFCLAGLWLGFEVIRRSSASPADARQLFMIAAGALAFGGSGIALLVYARHDRQREKEAERLKQLYSDQPWMWRPDWASGRIEGSNQRSMVFGWTFALLWNSISAPLLVLLPEEVFEKRNHAALLGLLFPLVGAGLVIGATRATLRWRKFGASTFEMTAVPAVIGGRLDGAIRTGLHSPPSSGVRLKLTCLQHTQGRGRKRTSHEKILWQDEQQLAPEHLRLGSRGIVVPVEFSIPPDCAGWERNGPGRQVDWVLQADANVAGIDYQTQFDVPVVKAPESVQASRSKELGTERSRALGREFERPFDPRFATVEVRPSARGGWQYVFRSARNVGAGVSTTLFFALWLGMLWLEIYFQVPGLFVVVTGLFGVLLLLIVLDLWFAASRVVIESGNVRVKRTLFGVGRTKDLPCSEIADVKLRIGMQQNQTLTQSARAYYDIEFHRRSGRKLIAGRNIRDKREAEWLASAMKQQIEAFR